MSTAYITHEGCSLHAMGSGHPEQSARLGAIADGLRGAGLYDRLTHIEAPVATQAQLRRAHAAGYIRQLETVAPDDDGLVRLDPDTAMNRSTWPAALRAAGSVVLGVDRVLGGDDHAAFCAVRPPGHHAERNRAMGFCFLNNVAIGALHALEVHGLARVAIVDFDVHFGNGTADIVAGDERVLLCSSYQYPLYPLAGPAPQAVNLVNTPLPAGSDGDVFRREVNRRWLPALAEFAPELVLFSAGFDAHVDDPLGGLCWVEDDYAWITREVRLATRASAGGRAVATLEGGYDLAALGCSAAAHVGALMTPL